MTTRNLLILTFSAAICAAMISGMAGLLLDRDRASVKRASAILLAALVLGAIEVAVLWHL